jgi:hypothetical protein
MLRERVKRGTKSGPKGPEMTRVRGKGPNKDQGRKKGPSGEKGSKAGNVHNDIRGLEPQFINLRIIWGTTV